MSTTLTIQSLPGALSFGFVDTTITDPAHQPALNLWWFDSATPKWRRLPDYVTDAAGGLKSPRYRSFARKLVFNSLAGNAGTDAVPATLLTDPHFFFATYGASDLFITTPTVSEDASATAVAGEFNLTLDVVASAEIHVGAKVADKRYELLTSEASFAVDSAVITFVGGETDPSARGIQTGMRVEGPGVPEGAVVDDVGSNTVTLNMDLVDDGSTDAQFDFWEDNLGGIYEIVTEPATVGGLLYLNKPLPSSFTSKPIRIFACPLEASAPGGMGDTAPASLSVIYPGQVVYHAPEGTEAVLPVVTVTDVTKDDAGQTTFNLVFGNQVGVVGYYVNRMTAEPAEVALFSGALKTPGTSASVSFPEVGDLEMTLRVYAVFGTDEYTRTTRDFVVRAPSEVTTEIVPNPPDVVTMALDLAAASPMVALLDEVTGTITGKITHYAGDSVRFRWKLVTSDETGTLSPWMGFDDPGSSSVMELSALTLTVVGTDLNLPDESGITRTGNVLNLHQSLRTAAGSAIADLPTTIGTQGPVTIALDLSADVAAIDWTAPALKAKTETTFRLILKAVFSGTPSSTKTVLDIPLVVKKNG